MSENEEDLQEVWLFNFALEGENGEKFNNSKPNELMEVIIQWAEQNQCQVGGGFRKPKKGEFDKPFRLKKH